MMNVEELLLIEDHQADARLVEEYLSEASGNELSVRWEERLGSGLDVLRNGGADCVLLDLGLPDSEGVESVGRVVEMAGATPVVVLTGLDDENAAIRAVQSGADDYLRKDDLTPKALRRAVRYARERRRLQAAVREEADRLEDILDTVSEGVLVVGPDLELRFANLAAARILGVDRDELLRKGFDDPSWSVRTLECGELPEGCRPVEHALRSGHAVEDVEVAVARPDGREQVLSVNATPLAPGSEGAGGAVVSIRDVTERRRHEQELRHRALHDTLTGLPNRALFHDRLEHVLSSVPRTGETVAVLFLDIDRFKVINDSLGHEAGDRLLERIGERLAASVRDSDTVARMGGDEFTVLLEGVPDESVVEKRAERILAALEAPMTLGDQEIHVELSMGIALYDHLEAEEDLSETDALIARADEAMFRAKEAPGTRYRFASPTRDPGAPSQLQTETRLRSALEDGGIGTHYQPIFDLDSGRVAGLEALARWDDPELGSVSPGRFIPLAEQTGLIVELGRQQLRRASRQVAEWSRRHAGASDLRLHVNLSLGELDDPGVARQLGEALEETGLPAERLWLEITESVTMRQPDRLAELSDLGPRLTVDDFGTRYSTLTQLKRLNLSGLKIDRSFVSGVTEDPQDLAIVESVVTLGHRLGFEVVAEGIETEGQLHLLREMGCDHGQGFLLGRPMPASEIPRLLERSPPAPEESAATARSDRSSRQRRSRAAVAPGDGMRYR